MYSNEELSLLEQQVETSYPVSMIRDLQELKAETKSDTVARIIDTVIDIVVDNTVWSN